MTTKRIQLDAAVKAALEDGEMLPPQLIVNGSTYALQRHVGSGYKGVVWQAVNPFGFPVALKLATYEDYAEQSYLNEVSRLQALQGVSEFAGFYDAGLVDLDLREHGTLRFVAFIEQWIEGETVEGFIRSHPEQLTASFLVAYVTAMCRALNVLRAAGLVHDDLHLGNAMIVPAGPSSLDDGQMLFKVIDTGSLKPAPSKKTRDDHLNFVGNIIAISTRSELGGPCLAATATF